MVQGKPISNLVHLAAWLTGVLVSLAVGFGMIDEILTVRFIPNIITVIAGWIVIALTVISVIMVIINKFS